MARATVSAAISISLMILPAASPASAYTLKDQSRIGVEDSDTPKQRGPSPFAPEPGTQPPGAGNGEPYNEDNVPFEAVEPGEMPRIETTELTIDSARRAVNALSEVFERYNDQGIENYETLEQFVAETEAGKRLQTDIQQHGFKDITDWNITIASVGFAYGAIMHDHETEIRQQILELRADTEIEADTRTLMIESLEAMLPSENNKQVIRQLIRIGDYANKLRLLDTAE